MNKLNGDINIERLILTNLVHNDEYAKKVFPFLKSEYFSEYSDKTIFNHIKSFTDKYAKTPTREALLISVDNDKNIHEESYNSIKDTISNLIQDSTPDLNWLVDETESFCKQKSIFNAVMTTVKIFNKEDKKLDVGSIPKLLSDAIAVSFDPRVGHSYLDNADERFESYHRKEEKISFDLTYMNRITNGGLVKKSLNIILAGTGAGKSLAMCHFASANLSDGKNVLYITLEMSEEKIAERIDANLLDVNIQDIKNMPEGSFKKKIEDIRSKTVGKLIVKEYPTASANVNHFRHLLNELKIRQRFVPDIIYVDYLNLCTSSRVKFGSNVNTYSLVKSIAEELRGMAVEYDVPIMSATQVNRGGFQSSDFGLENTSDSFGLPSTADLMFALISTEELESLNQILIKQLKNRYNDVSKNRKFVVGINRAKMRLYDLEESAQANLTQSDNSNDGIKKKSYKKKFEPDKKKLEQIDFSDDDMF